MWSSLGAGSASLKFRQFKSAVCDVFGVIFVCGDVVCFVGYWGFRATCFSPLYCWIDGWGLVIWLDAGLLVV